MNNRIELPDGLELVRTTDVMDQDHHPAGLLRAHRVAEGVWGRLLIHSGSLTFVFEDDPQPIELGAGEHIVIPPGRLHHVELGRPATFAIEFHREPSPVTLVTGKESTGLEEH
ncbi:MAG TPA: DUF1971 domain-containing protein [Ilumatobacteraceae bacterium]|nr:DUF1971 domain-containing protein [Ilumatobacteraceae bacterium]